MQDKKLWTLKESLRDTLQDLVTLQDASKIIEDEEAKDVINNQIWEKVEENTKKDLEAIAGAMQQMRRNTASYVEHSDLELEKYFNLDLLFTIQEYLDQYED